MTFHSEPGALRRERYAREPVGPVRIQPIIPVVHREPFDDPQWLFELKWDGFRGIADTVNGRMLSKNNNHFRKYDRLLRVLPAGCVFDGEIVVLDADGRPV